jgi:hypothetical protein
VKFINTDGMALIGPGSEWLWTAVSAIALVVTLLVLYRELRLRRANASIEQMKAFALEWDSERMLRHQLDILLALKAGTDPARLPQAAARLLGNYWENLGDLTRNGHVRLENIDGNHCRAWWATLHPSLKSLEESWQLVMFAQFEWLVGKMAELGDPANRSSFDRAHLDAQLDTRIVRTQDAIRVEQALRTVMIASPDTPIVARRRRHLSRESAVTEA